MKFVITESKRGELIDKYLSKDYGELIRYEPKNIPDLIFFVKDTKKEPIKRDIVFFIIKKTKLHLFLGKWLHIPICSPEMKVSLKDMLRDG